MKHVAAAAILAIGLVVAANAQQGYRQVSEVQPCPCGPQVEDLRTYVSQPQTSQLELLIPEVEGDGFAITDLVFLPTSSIGNFTLLLPNNPPQLDEVWRAALEIGYVSLNTPIVVPGGMAVYANEPVSVTGYVIHNSPCVTDLNNDSTTDSADLAVLVGNWGTCE